MKFDTPANANPIDQGKVVGKPLPRVEGPLKVSGRATYAAEWHAEFPNLAHGVIVGAAVATGRLTRLDTTAARAAPGVVAVVTAESAGPLGKGSRNAAKLLGGPEIDHYHQAIALVVADTFEQATAAARLVRAEYDRTDGAFVLEAAADAGAVPIQKGVSADSAIGDFAAGYAGAPVTIEATYTTTDVSHMMMEPFATIAQWNGDNLVVHTSNQLIDTGRSDLAKTLGIPKDKVRMISPYIGGGFGGKLWIRADAVLAALGAKAAGRPVKVVMARPMMPNNSVHRPATIQKLRLGAARDGKLVAIGHDCFCGNLPGGSPDGAARTTRVVYAAPNRLTRTRMQRLDLPEGNAMRAPGDATGSIGLEVAMDELAEKLGMDPIALRLANDTLTDPEKPEKKFSQRRLAECLKLGADKFGWAKRGKPGARREGQWLIGMGMASAERESPALRSAARVKLEAGGRVVVETDMTDIGTGSYTIIAQTAAEMMGVPIGQVTVRLGDSDFPVSSGSGGQFGANSATSGVYAACAKLREMVAAKLEMDAVSASFAGGKVSAGGKSVSLASAAPLVAEDFIVFGGPRDEYRETTFGAHFVEVAVDVYTAEIRLRRMLAVMQAGRILNPMTARSQVIGAMTMGAGAVLREELVVDPRFGLFVNHDLAQYEVPVHADIPHQEVIFLDGPDPLSSPMKAHGVGELGICGVGAAVINAVHNATGVRVRNYPITIDKLLEHMPAV